MTVVIDEYPYMREGIEDGVLDSYIQRIIDIRGGRISIVLSGFDFDISESPDRSIDGEEIYAL